MTYVVILAHCLAFTLFCVKHTRFDPTLRHRQRMFGSLFLTCGVRSVIRMFSLRLTVAVRTPDRRFYSSLHQAAFFILFRHLVGFIKSSHEAVIVSCEGLRNSRCHNSADGRTSFRACYAMSNALTPKITLLRNFGSYLLADTT